MRLVCCGSSLLSCRSASTDNSTFHVMTFHDVFKWDGGLFVVADAVQGTFGQIDVLEILQVLQDGFANIVGLGAASTPSQLFKPPFNRLWKSNGQHSYPAIQV